MRICRLDGQKMRRKHLLTFARLRVMYAGRDIDNQLNLHTKQ